MTESKVNYTGLGLILGSAVGFAFGMIVATSTGEYSYLLVGLVGTALGLIAGAAVDHSKRQA